MPLPQEQLLQNEVEQVFFTPDHLTIVDMAVQREDGVLVSHYMRETVEQMSIRHPGVYIETMENAIRLKEEVLKSAPVEITEEDFMEALECLPPLNWVGENGAASFKMMEFYSGRITGVYVRLAERYFVFNDVFSITHDEAVAKVKASLNEI